MIKTLAAQIKEYRTVSIITPIFMILEVVFEMLIPFLMASIIDDGVEAGSRIIWYAICIFVTSVVSLVTSPAVLNLSRLAKEKV
mgnify:CR=1 FL=1